jgi:cobalt-zinc-cadmium efflux system outer membrane protein
MGQSVLSEAEALAKLSPDSPRVRAIRAAIDIARADVLSAGRWPNPRASFNREAVAGVTENMLTVSQILPITGRRSLEVASATAMVDAASLRADDELRRARWELRAAYADLVSAQLREQELTRTRDRLGALADVLARREAAGDAAGYDRLRAEREVFEIEDERFRARAERLRSQAALAVFFAEPIDPSAIVAVSPAVVHTVLPTVDELVARADIIRREPAALVKESESARLSEEAASRGLWPEPEVVVGTKSSNALGGDLGGVVSVHATVPLFERAEPEHARARARVAQADARASLFRARLHADISVLRMAAIERRDAAERYRTTAFQAADRLEQIAQVSYDAGERGILELLDAYRTGASARSRQAVLDLAVRQVELELEFVSGWEVP